MTVLIDEGTEVLCADCGEPLPPSRSSSSRWCSERCRHRAYMREWRERRKNEIANSPESVQHGTRYIYSVGCRCDGCSAASRAAAIERQHWLTPEHEDSQRRYEDQYRKARNGGQFWSGEEVAFATDVDEAGRYLRTCGEVARVLGRTIGAIEKVRARVRKDPRLRIRRDGPSRRDARWTR